jgi:diguanylate cyclase
MAPDEGLQAGRDRLTGVLNRDGFNEAVSDLPVDLPVALALVDIDDFKDLNDSFGHDAGDALLVQVARTLTGSLPDTAIVARHGGDEFLVLLPDRSAESALILIEEVRAHLVAHPVEQGRSVTISAGVAARPPHGSTIDELLRAADQAMYRAKAEGRNRVAIYVDEKMVMKSNYYDRGALSRLAKLSANTGRTEASLLREALDDLFVKHAGEL